MHLVNCLAALVLVLCSLSTFSAVNRTFSVDWQNNRFLKDNEPFRFIAGSFHYFRAHPETWQRKLRTMRAGGLNAVTTYVEWSLHNPHEGVYVWDGIADLEKFIKLAIAEDLLVILRPGPYICAERDLGGLPYWLLNKYPNIALRTTDINFLYEVRVWYSQLMARMSQYLYGNGGPIIMVQVENEYGSFACDKKYRNWMRDETLSHVKDNAVLFTNDGPGMVNCGYIDGVLATLDFGSTNNVSAFWEPLRRVQPQGPLVNSEYYPGWLTHWSESMARVTTRSITKTFKDMLDADASVNFYMFYGGTNFGFTAGANDGGPGHYQPDITSYDYDAPMDEAGDPTSKFFKIREIIGSYLPLPNIPVPEPTPKKAYGKLHLTACCTLLSPEGRRSLSTGTILSDKPKTFEALNQYSGLVLYETNLPHSKRDPSMLHLNGLADRAYIYVDNKFVGILSRETPVNDLPISLVYGKQLQILVENQGRVNYGQIHDFKGLTGDVKYENRVLKNWNITKYPLESYEDIHKYIEGNLFGESNDLVKSQDIVNDIIHKDLMLNGPTIFWGDLEITDDVTCDTYLDTSGWGKGIVFVNGENLGRYWPLAGPQVTLYVPREVLRKGLNRIVLIEYQNAASTNEIRFTDKPNFGGLK